LPLYRLGDLHPVNLGVRRFHLDLNEVKPVEVLTNVLSRSLKFFS
jgi:hypothetical protein